MNFQFTRKHQLILLSAFVTGCILVGVAGIYALKTAPTLYTGSHILSEEKNIHISKVENISLPAAGQWILPLFILPKDEHQWWQVQKDLHQTLKNKDTLIVDVIRTDGISEQLNATVGEMSLNEVMRRTGLLYIVGLVYLVTAISVFRRHASTSGFLCVCFLASTALYIISLAPVVHRALFLDYDLMRWLVSIFFISSTGQIAIVHFSFIFPQKKQFMINHPRAYIMCYGYSALISALYLLGLIAIATTVPFLMIWILIMLGAFIHTLVSEGDLFMKKQARNGFMAAILVVIFIVVSIVLPWNLGGTLVNNFALFSLMLPFALIASLDNHYLYHQRLTAERESQIEKARIHRELHDTALNNLASISIISEGAQRFLQNDPDKAQERLQQVKNIASETSRQLRNFLWVIDDQKNNWTDVVKLLRKTGYDLLSPLNIEFNFHTEDNQLPAEPPTPAIKHTVHRIFRETIVNIVKHANAKTVSAALTFNGKILRFEIKDDGSGFDMETIKNTSFGLNNIKRRVDETGGQLVIETGQGKGTRVMVELPLA